MYTTNDVKNLAGLAWDEFFRLVDNHHHQHVMKQSVLLPVQPKCNEDVAMLPHKKATCYGSCSVTETPKLVKCQSCNLVVKTVAFGHHQKIHHSHFCSPTLRSISSDSDSDDDCQGFLLSPPHHPTPAVSSSSETLLDLKFVEDTKWTISESLKNHSSFIGENNPKDEKNMKASRQSPPRYDVQRRNDLRLVLTKRRSSFTKMKTQKASHDQCHQSTPLVSISITGPGGLQQKCVEITERSLKTPKQTKVDKAKRSATTVRLNANEKCNKSREWSTSIQLSKEIFTADLEESEQSSIPLHHSPSESSDSDVEGNDHRNREMGIEQQLLEAAYLSSTHEFVREQCPQTADWNPRNAAERPSNVNKPNHMTLRHKLQQRRELARQKGPDDTQRSRTPAEKQSFVHKRTIGKGKMVQPRDKAPANSSGMVAVVEKLFKINGLSVTALSPDGKKKLALQKQRHGLPTSKQMGGDANVRTELCTHNFQFCNEKDANGQKPATSAAVVCPAKALSAFQLRMASPPSISSPSVPPMFSPNASIPIAAAADDDDDEALAGSKNWDLQVLESTIATEGPNSERHSSGRNSPPVHSLQRTGTFIVKQQKMQRKMSSSSTTTFAGVSWHKLDTQSVAPSHGQSPNVLQGSTANSQQHKSNGLRFVPLLNSANESVTEQQGNSNSTWQKRAQKMSSVRGAVALRHSSTSPQLLAESDQRPLDCVSGNQSPEFVCHIRPAVAAVHSAAAAASDGSPATAATFFGQTPSRKRSFILQQKVQTIANHQQPIEPKRSRLNGPRTNETALRMYTVDEQTNRQQPQSFPPDLAQPRADSVVQHQQQAPNSAWRRPAHSAPSFGQQFQPKVFSVFAPSAAPFAGDSTSARDDQLASSLSSADLRAFGRPLRQLYTVKSHQQNHYPMRHQPLHAPRQQSPFDIPSGDDQSHPSKFHGAQFGAAHGSASEFCAQRTIPVSEYSPQMMGKTTTSCAHLQQYHTCSGTQLTGVASELSCSSPQQSLFRHTHDGTSPGFFFATSLPPYASSSSSAPFNGLFPPVRHHPSDSFGASHQHQQHFLLQQPHFHHHPLAVLPASQCRHNCGARPIPSAAAASPHQNPMHGGQFSACRGGSFAAMASPHSEGFFMPPSYSFQQCQQQQIPHRFMRGQLHHHQQQQLQQNRLHSYGGTEADPEIFAIEPPPVLEAEGHISAPEEVPMNFEEGGGGTTTRSDSDASDMDLREILPQQQ